MGFIEKFLFIEDSTVQFETNMKQFTPLNSYPSKFYNHTTFTQVNNVESLCIPLSFLPGIQSLLTVR